MCRSSQAPEDTPDLNDYGINDSWILFYFRGLRGKAAQGSYFMACFEGLGQLHSRFSSFSFSNLSATVSNTYLSKWYPQMLHYSCLMPTLPIAHIQKGIYSA
jgi:hypothetical protein